MFMYLARPRGYSADVSSVFFCYLRGRRRLCFRCGLFVSLFVCLSVCLSVRRITRKLVNGF